ncbi:MAG: YaeQ family protein [Gammaproteobacteria bacterium]|nr:YaeQ family protein [Gammaproteobacteria bacterium]
MAQKATVFKADLLISDMDRHYYERHVLTIARHPSESDLRMMLRVAVFCLNARENLTFCKGVSTDDEPDLWQKNLTDEIEHWIDLGQPDEKRLRRACGRAKKVSVYAYRSRSARLWWQQNAGKLQRFENLSVFLIEEISESVLTGLVKKTMNLQAIIQDQELRLSDESTDVTITLETWKEAEKIQ